MCSINSRGTGLHNKFTASLHQLSDFLIHFECGDAKLFLYKGSNYGFHITPFITDWALSAARHSLFKHNHFLTA